MTVDFKLTLKPYTNMGEMTPTPGQEEDDSSGRLLTQESGPGLLALLLIILFTKSLSPYQK